jgi:glutamate dehydrogenase
MASRSPEVDEELIDVVVDRVRERLPEDQAGPCESFVRQYFHWVPPEDLADRNALDLYGAAVSHWNLAQHRRPTEAKLHVYNPDFEQHGWQSPHTVLQVVTADMPFLVDSVTMELSRLGYGTHLVIHPVIRVLRDEQGQLTHVTRPGGGSADSRPESILHIEIDRESDRDRLQALKGNLDRVLDDVRAAVEDWHGMRRRAEELIEELAANPAHAADRDLEEAQSFLRWLAENHFTFLGYREYHLLTSDDEDQPARIVADPGSGLGILRGPPKSPTTPLSDKALKLALTPAPLLLTKANSRSTVHRPAYLDYVGVKQFDEDGNVVGERRFLGLYTSSAYKESPLEIPLIRGKVRFVLERAGFPPDSHDHKALTEICEEYPRDSLFQVEAEELFRIAMGILGLGERQRVRLFVRPDMLERFVACIVCFPRDRFNTENRLKAAEILVGAFGGTHFDWSMQLTESTIAKVHYVVHCPDGIRPGWDEVELEQEIVSAIRAWTDDLRDVLVEEHGEQQGLPLLKRFEHAFPPAYRADWMARSAVSDIARIEELQQSGEPILRLYRPLEADETTLRCKLFSLARVSLSDVLPTFEHMGAKVVDERPYEITPAGEEPLWIYDFGMRCATEDLEQVYELFEDAFLGVWRGELEDDGLGGLVLRAGLTGRQVTIVRAIAKYLRQAGIAFSDAYMERTLMRHSDIAVLLVDLFHARLDPTHRDDPAAATITEAITDAIDGVQSLDEDRILRAFLSVITAILRTNYFQVDLASKQPKPYLSFKLDPQQVPILPHPRPRFEIFVYSPRVEGVHLRGGKVARGGLRWSDRREDFRTEILGLMKAQMVKNALIVPVGSKGGFVVKRPPPDAGRERLQAEAIECYKTFLRGLLDLTDNIVGQEVVPPSDVVRYDEDDPYLVVAADKGTATFSDLANEVSASYGFWLGDAFASGGSQGYDHKAMGITARGAWESVKRHFRGLGVDTQTTDFTCVGIGDMAGDVFGNGMLLSPHIRLVAAFNHAHVFLDPDPDAARSFQERQRLFDLPRSSWTDYDPGALSEGGGVYPRTAKKIPVSPQVRRALAIDAEELSPAEMISAILKAPVDLLWNGGIGTYVKASTESHADAGDKANDAVRVNGSALRCRVVGEGGNLGFTQRGRIEYALAGGRINTDAIDNVAGVNCSDHEVNIKILLGGLVAQGDMTEKQRNELLAEMTDSVADGVLYGSYTQTQAMSLALFQAPGMVDVHARLIRRLEQLGALDPEIEFLPDEAALSERRNEGRGLTAPELAVLMAYCKIHLHAELLESDLPEDPYLRHDLERYFPSPLPERYAEQMREHRLRREIIATVVSNQLVDRAGTTFVFRLAEETGAPPSILARGYAVAREVYGIRELWQEIEALDNQVAAENQLAMQIESRKLVERAARWLVRSNPAQIDIEALVRRYEPGARMLYKAMPEILEDDERAAFDTHAGQLIEAGTPERLARRVAAMPWLLPVFDIIEVASATDRNPEIVMQASFRVAARLKLGWLRERILELPRNDRWQALARAALRDDLDSLVRVLSQEVLEAGRAAGASTAEEALEAWVEGHRPAVERCLQMLSDIQASRTYDTTTLPVALREIRNLVRTSAAGPAAAGESPAPNAEGALAG